eukprot:6484751-Lingulodinium_polyedra.AAC.1
MAGTRSKRHEGSDPNGPREPLVASLLWPPPGGGGRLRLAAPPRRCTARRGVDTCGARQRLRGGQSVSARQPDAESPGSGNTSER